MEYKNQTENRAFQEMLQVAVKRLQNRSGEDIAAKSGAVFHSSRNVLEVLSFYETIEIHEYYGAAEPPVRCGESHLSGLTEPPQFVY